ncbi:O-methyltransferase [Williamsia deligens]|uniref:O-methyltransferase n=1 Tax=Williamsia deligens TaxID=321325 RepID=A0ABW3GBW1_9NOCA|nr:class I SAM-dependent methyltransferase [Williamsia deligens]MCP2195137.1 Methyltransferase domain-containing protein [Williamsia deligens]
MGFERLEQIVDEARANGWYVEGSANAAQLESLRQLAEDDRIRSVVEIGFNVGFSSHAFLSADPQTQVTSFDLGDHEYVSSAKACIDDEFPGRHTLITGDSRETVPQYADDHPGQTFDLIFIDGGHTHEVALADIQNMRRLAGPETVLVFDDVLPHKPWGEGPIRAWQDVIADGTVVETGLFADGVQVDAVGPDAARAWVVGKYVV